MSITARLCDSVRRPGEDAPLLGFGFESRGTGPRRALLRNGHELEVYDLGEVFAGEHAPGAAAGQAPHSWAYYGFVDADVDAVIASTVEPEEDGKQTRQWLLDARTLDMYGHVTSPTGPRDSGVRTLGDGTWLTYDTNREMLDRRTRTAPSSPGVDGSRDRTRPSVPWPRHHRGGQVTKLVRRVCAEPSARPSCRRARPTPGGDGA